MVDIELKIQERQLNRAIEVLKEIAATSPDPEACPDGRGGWCKCSGCVGFIETAVDALDEIDRCIPFNTKLEAQEATPDER